MTRRSPEGMPETGVAMLRGIHLKGVGPAPEMELALAPRLNLLTGDNGVGKSFLLDIAWWALTGGWAERPAWPDPDMEGQPRIEYGLEVGRVKSEFDFASQSWSTEFVDHFDDPPTIIVYAHVNGAFSLWDFARNSWGDLPPYHFLAGSLWNGLAEGEKILCEGLIRDWVSWQRQGTDSFSRLVKVLKNLSPSEHEELRPGQPVPVSVLDVRDHPTLEMPYGRVPLIFASEGMKRIIGLAYLLVWAWQEHLRVTGLRRIPPAERVVFLIDEVESHLHPKWQRLLLPALLSVASALGSQADVQIIATTHSPLVLASVEPVFQEEQDKLIHLRLEGHEVRIEDLPWAKQGDAANWLVSDVFGLHQARSKEAERAIEAAEAWMRGDYGVLPKELGSREAIHAELVRVLAGHDDFWPRWIVASENTVASGAQRR